MRKQRRRKQESKNKSFVRHFFKRQRRISKETPFFSTKRANEEFLPRNFNMLTNVVHLNTRVFGVCCIWSVSRHSSVVCDSLAITTTRRSIRIQANGMPQWSVPRCIQWTTYSYCNQFRMQSEQNWRIREFIEQFESNYLF